MAELALPESADKLADMILPRPRWDYARRKAKELARVYTAPPIPVIEIAEGQGVEVVFGEFAGHSDTVAGYCDFEEKQIVVNDADKLGRKLFTIAHELGHWVLHRELFEKEPSAYTVLPRYQDTSDRNNIEKEANAFAAELLVPIRLLDPIRDYPVTALADIFSVSKTMMEYRIKSAG